ncbi:M56 family metallopeptidase [Aquisphaera insulae]|uniref:M56 family metallopeptidase n=1 Tax=Aquisphaera insulae TaxID=2712864 RepID=UPI0013EA25F3|nr:M56 family metallopeptidase [Aquisphaera insulae]
MNDLLNLGLSNAAAACVMAVGVALAGLLLGSRPAWRHWLLLLVLLKLVTPPIWELPIPRLDQDRPAELAAPEQNDLGPMSVEIVELPDDAVIAAPTPAELPPAPAPSSVSASAVLAAIWVVGVVVSLGTAGVRIVRFRRRLRAAYSAPDEVHEELAELSDRLGVTRTPTAWMLDEEVSPMVWPLGVRPAIILPVRLWKGLDGRQRSMVLAHELAHLRRGDHVLRLFELAVTSLYWWLPVTWWARRALREAEEQCCDAWVVWAFPDEARAYAETLLDTIDFLTPTPSAAPLLASGFGRTQQLRRRLTMIMLGTTPRSLGAASTFAAFALSAILLPMRPSLAQKPGEDAKKETVTVTASAIASDDEVATINVVGDAILEDDPNVVDVRVEGPEPGRPAELKTITLRAVGDEPKSVETTANVTIDDVKVEGKPKQSIHIVLKNGDKVDDIKADSVEAAVKQLKDHLAELATKEPKDETWKARNKALQSALDSLAKTKTVVIGRQLGTRQGVVVASPVSPEEAAKNKARVEELRKDVSKLQKELSEKQRELAGKQREIAEKHREIAKLSGQMVVRGTLKVNAEPRREIRSVVVRDIHKEEPKDAKAGALNGDERKRLESLEKNLAKLLDEVKDLKKHDGGDKPK